MGSYCRDSKSIPSFRRSARARGLLARRRRPRGRDDLLVLRIRDRSGPRHRPSAWARPAAGAAAGRRARRVAALSPADVVLPVQVITSGGALLWSLQVDALPEAGSFRGTVTFDAGGFYLGHSGITVDLDFRDDGTVAGRVDTEAACCGRSRSR
jgi:hypothetical protein